MNLLRDATSPYLLQHADNPVHWQEWSPEAFAEATQRDVPVLLSVGYAACHWCHVMAEESFSHDDVATAINNDFVAIKVDREERPDVDSVYMSATQAMTGQGGWPMTCFLTPEGEPFFCGTYYPRPQFLQLLEAVRQAWQERRDSLLDSSQQVTAAIRQLSTAPTAGELDATALGEAQATLATSFDPHNGGFGDAPKFPPSMVMEFLLRHYARTGEPEALAMVESSCEAMARGGLYDQLGGGFARYSVDAQWVVPHFEKMLYDNALLLRDYLHLYRATGSQLAYRVVHETAEFLLRDMRTAEGGFASSLDADTEEGEGRSYVWTPAQLIDALGPQDGARAARLLHVTGPGTFEAGTSVLQLPEDPDDWAWWQRVRASLLTHRMARPQPARDDKVVTAWNGLAIAALAEAGALLEEPRYLTAAAACAQLLLTTHVVDGRVYRSSRAETVSRPAGVATDYGNLAEGLIALHQATAPHPDVPHASGVPHSDRRPAEAENWLARAGDVLDVALRHFPDDAGGFFDVADDAEELITRPRELTDNAEPSGTSSLAAALLSYAALTGVQRHQLAAERAVAAASEIARQAPRFAGWTLAVAEALLAGPLQVAVAGHGADAEAMVHVARKATSPGLVLTAGEQDSEPLLVDRGALDGEPTAYVCRGFVCDAPVTTLEGLRAALL